jgi:hypothetical protein
VPREWVMRIKADRPIAHSLYNNSAINRASIRLERYTPACSRPGTISILSNPYERDEKMLVQPQIFTTKRIAINGAIRHD